MCAELVFCTPFPTVCIGEDATLGSRTAIDIVDVIWGTGLGFLISSNTLPSSSERRGSPIAYTAPRESPYPVQARSMVRFLVLGKGRGGSFVRARSGLGRVADVW